MRTHLTTATARPGPSPCARPAGPRWTLAAAATLAVLAPGCVIDDRDCRGGVDVEGDPSAYTVPAGPQAEGYEVGPPTTCHDGVTSIAVRGPAAASGRLADGDPDAFFEALLADLRSRGATVFGPGQTLVECIGDPVGASPYLYFLQLRDLAWADVTVTSLGAALAGSGLADAVGVQVGLPVSCPM